MYTEAHSNDLNWLWCNKKAAHRMAYPQWNLVGKSCTNQARIQSTSQGTELQLVRFDCILNGVWASELCTGGVSEYASVAACDESWIFFAGMW